MNQASTKTEAAPASDMSQGRPVEHVFLPINGIGFPADLVVPPGAQGLVLSVVTNGGIHDNPRADLLIRAIEARGVATLSFSLLTSAEAHEDGRSRDWSFELDLLAHRLLQATSWAMRQPQTRDLGIGYAGAGTFAAAALVAAAQLGYAVQAVVSRSGRADFALDALPHIMASTLLIVGERNRSLTGINRDAFSQLRCPKRLSIITGAGHLFNEPGTLEQVSVLGADWFSTHLKEIKRT